MPKFFILFFVFCLVGWIFLTIFARNFSAFCCDNVAVLSTVRNKSVSLSPINHKKQLLI